MAELDSLFTSGGLNDKSNFLNDKPAKNADGIYRIDLEKVKDKKRGWKVTGRLLPNLSKERKLGENAIEKITHFVDIKNNKDLTGYYDSPKNFDKKATCPLSTLHFQLKESNMAMLKERAELLSYSKKYYSYFLILEDEQNPDLVGKIMILQYGKQLKDKIAAEHNGDLGEKCDVFDITNGKDLILIAKETMGPKGKPVPEYNSSQFKSSQTSLPIWNEEKRTFKNVPTVENSEGIKKIDPKYQNAVVEFLLNREHELDTFAPQALTDEQKAKITGITNMLLGKTSSEKPATSDFDFEEHATTPSAASTSSSSDDTDDFFNFD